ncbi:hypothetical protein HanPSC8_Chr08g0327021 [Helianthus annuus]|nr:hypothetical protein HanPSC8_Chr08g0327021 [Helianthus annuus]
MIYNVNLVWRAFKRRIATKGGYCTDLPAAGVIPLHKLATSQCCLAVNTPSRAESVSLWKEGGRIPPAWTRTRVSMKSRGGTGQLGHPSWLFSMCKLSKTTH